MLTEARMKEIYGEFTDPQNIHTMQTNRGLHIGWALKKEMSVRDPTVIDNVELHILTTRPNILLHWGLNLNNDPTWYCPFEPYPLEVVKVEASAIQSKFLPNEELFGPGLFCVQIKLYNLNRFGDRVVSGISFVIPDHPEWHKAPDNKDIRISFGNC